MKEVSRGQGGSNNHEPARPDFSNLQCDQAPHGGGSKSPEYQAPPSVWDVLERQVRLYAPNSPRITTEERRREVMALNRLEDEMEEKGASRDKHISNLYRTIIRPKPGTSPLSFRYLTLEEFQQFRTRIEPLSDNEIAEEIYKAEAERDRQWEELMKNTDPPIFGLESHSSFRRTPKTT